MEKLESTYKKNLDVEQVWVYGNSFKSCLLAVVVPTVSAAEKWGAANGVKGTYAEICASEAYSAALLKDLQATGGWPGAVLGRCCCCCCCPPAGA